VAHTFTQPWGSPLYPTKGWGKIDNMINPRNEWGVNNDLIYKIEVVGGEKIDFCFNNLHLNHLRDDIYFFN
jgi:hypothetical protein